MVEIIKVKFDPLTKSSGVQGIQNSEYMLRMHYLMQASEIVEDPTLKRFYASEIKNIAKRNVLRT
jgi:RNase P subunit RPR2